jgi:hypothetical protein
MVSISSSAWRSAGKPDFTDTVAISHTTTHDRVHRARLDHDLVADLLPSDLSSARRLLGTVGKDGVFEALGEAVDGLGGSPIVSKGAYCDHEAR